MTGEVNVKGLKELGTALQGLPDKLQRNVMRAALRAGAKLVADQARESVPVDSGALRRSVKVGTRVQRGVVQANVKAGDKEAWYARFVEFGTAAHTIKARDGGYMMFGGAWVRSVSHPGARARPFLRPALDARADAAVRATAEKMRQILATKHGIDVAQPAEEGDE